MKKRVLLLSLLVAGALSANAQVLLTGTNPTYAQDFNTLSTTAGSTTNNLTITGWALAEVRANANQQYRVGDGSANAGDVYSFGTGTNTDRCLGGLASGSLLPRFGVTFLNNTGNAITSITVGFRGEQWRRGNTTAGNKDSLYFAYSTNASSVADTLATWTNVSSLLFTSINTTTTAGPLDGNTVNTNLTGTLTVNIPAGNKIHFRWLDPNIGGNDDGLGIDDFAAAFTTTTGGTPDTLVRFAPVAATVAENSVSYNLAVSYSPTSGLAHSAQVVLKSGNAANIGNYTTQTVNFPANTATASLPITITDNAIQDGNKTFVFALRNPAGLLLSADSLFTLTVTDDDAPVVNEYPLYTIARVRGNNTGGQPDSLNVKCELRGTVYGVNLRTGGLEFTIHDGTAGIGVFSPVSAGNLGYTVNEGDSIQLRGEILVYSGLAQIGFLDTLIVAGQGHLANPTVVTNLSESTESALIRLNGYRLANASQWTNTGLSFTVDITNGTNTFKMRVHSNTSLFGTPAPSGVFSVIGIGSQFLGTTATAPFTGGYQIVPRKLQDVLLGGSISENEASANLSVFPNPTDGRFFVRFESKASGNGVVSLKDLSGRTVYSKNVSLVNGSNQLELNEELSSGIYLVNIQVGSERAVKRIVVR